MVSNPFAFGQNMVGQEQWARRGENDARLSSLETSRTTDEARLTSLENPAACRVYNSAAIGLTTGTEASLGFDSERFDPQEMHNTVTNPERITFVIAGVYVVTLNAAFASNATGLRLLAIRLNGATYLAYVLQVPVTGDNTNMLVTTTWKFAAGDYVEARAKQTSGGGLNINAAGNHSPEFSAVRTGAG